MHSSALNGPAGPRASSLSQCGLCALNVTLRGKLMPMSASPPSVKKTSLLSPNAIAFRSIKSRSDLANWIGIKESTLIYILYRLPTSKKYTDFLIPKRNGGARLISAPRKALKYAQKRISSVLYDISPPRNLSKGYIPGRGIFDHAYRHRRRSTVVTADIKGFFPSINFGRVRGMFAAAPFSLPLDVATMLAQLCCKDGELPQGSPSSPAISNIICRSLDLDLAGFSRKHRITVTRYADDVCFSTNMRKHLFPLVERNDLLGDVPGGEVSRIFEKNGFELNLKKFNLSKSNSRQMITGLIVNSHVNVPRQWMRQLRTLLHLRSRMEDAQATEIANTWARPQASRKGVTESIDHLIRGKASFAAYIDSRSGTRHIASLHRGYPKLRQMLPRMNPSFPVRIMAEGPTDLLHLEAALRHCSDRIDFSNVALRLHNYQGDVGDVDMIKTLHRINKVDVEELTIGIFDHDNPSFLKEISLNEGSHVRLGRMVFAACLSRPKFVTENYCIESLYKRSDSSKVTSEGRRLYFSDEFDAEGLHLHGVLRRQYPKKTALVLSERVFDPKDPTISLTLSKADFAAMVNAGAAPFNDMDFSGFLPTLAHLRKMIDEAMYFSGNS